MIKLTNPLNKDGILYKKGAILTLSLKDEEELVANELAEKYPLIQMEQEAKCNRLDLDEEVASDEPEKKEEVETEKEDTKTKENKKTSPRIGRTSKK